MPVGGVGNTTMKKLLNLFTRSKPACSDEDNGDDTSKMVIIPRFLFLILAVLPLMLGGVVLWLSRHYADLDNPTLPRVVKIDGACTVEAKEITIKAENGVFRLGPVLPSTTSK